MTRLTNAEKEVILSYDHAEEVWHVYADAKVGRLTSRMKKIAKVLGIEPAVREDGAIEFDVPLNALRISPKRRKGGKKDGQAG